MAGESEQMVNIVLNGIVTLSKLAGKAIGSIVKNGVAIVAAIVKNRKSKVAGKTSMKKLLRSGDKLQTVELTKEQYKEFKHRAKKKILYTPFINKKDKNEMISIVFSDRSVPLVNAVLNKMKYATLADEADKNIKDKNEISGDDPKKKDIQLSENSKDAKDNLNSKKKESGHREDKPSVVAKLEKFDEEIKKEQARERTGERHRRYYDSDLITGDSKADGTVFVEKKPGAKKTRENRKARSNAKPEKRTKTKGLEL